MKVITKYQAYTGQEFHTEHECMAYEDKCRAVDRIMEQIPPRYEDGTCDFSNGSGFIQHDLKTIKKVRLELLEEAKKDSDHRWIQESIDDETVHSSWAGRIINECCISRLDKAWHRISCMDSLGREWGQPFYATHPDKAKQICLNALSQPTEQTGKEV